MPAKTGTMKVKIMIVPCEEISSLYWPLVIDCMPGLASSARKTSANRPPTRYMMNVKTMYWIPITL